MTTLQVSLQSQSLLFRLPRECRDIIYHLYAEGLYSNDEYWDTTKRPEEQFLLKPYGNDFPPLLETCKRVYQEAGPLVLNTAALKISYHFSFRVSIRAIGAGNMDLNRLWKLTVFASAGAFGESDLYRFLRLMVNLDKDTSWHQQLDKRWPGGDPPGARNLKHLVIVCLPIPTSPFNRYDEREVLESPYSRKDQRLHKYLSRIQSLEIIELRGKHPKSWAENIRALTRARVIEA
ncbi:hypothetical protein GQ53DRAFT_749372 [Thozetella sp. PMI_491]|nr:hypothetical protein GQ53DRAFT_749372 [Thozetella sp. PMI_491]